MSENTTANQLGHMMNGVHSTISGSQENLARQVIRDVASALVPLGFTAVLLYPDELGGAVIRNGKILGLMNDPELGLSPSDRIDIRYVIRKVNELFPVKEAIDLNGAMGEGSFKDIILKDAKVVDEMWGRMSQDIYAPSDKN